MSTSEEATREIQTVASLTWMAILLPAGIDFSFTLIPSQEATK